MDHRGGLGRGTTDAHLAASLSVAVRRLAVSEPAPATSSAGGGGGEEGEERTRAREGDAQSGRRGRAEGSDERVENVEGEERTRGCIPAQTPSDSALSGVERLLRGGIIHQAAGLSLTLCVCFSLSLSLSFCGSPVLPFE